MARLRDDPAYRFAHVGTLTAPAGLDELVRVSMGPEGPVAVWAQPGDRDEFVARDTNGAGASFARSRTATSPRVALASYLGGCLSPSHQVVVSGLPVAFPFVQPLADGGFVVAGARCSWRSTGPEHNALRIGSDGAIMHTGTIGDGIADLLVDRRDGLWAGYFDEGIFGNHGWGDPGPDPLGAAGIVRWSTAFEKIWEYQETDGHQIADCYALNVADDRVWACPYTDFPLIQILPDRVTIEPTTNVGGPNGVLVAGGTVGFVGGYHDVGSLTFGSVVSPRQLRTSRLTMPDGRPVPPGVLVCRGSTAHLFVGADWFTFDLAVSGASAWG